MKLRIILLKDNLEYFDEFVNMIYDEWKDIYHMYDLHTKIQVSEFYNKFKQRIYIALDDKTLVGCYSFSHNTISDVFVAREYRKYGIGHNIMNDAIRRLFYYYTVRLYCDKKTLKFYKDCGFEVADASDPNMILMIRRNHMLVVMIVAILIIVSLVCL